MNDLFTIFLCMFAVFGIYRFCIGLCAWFSKGARSVYAVRAGKSTDIKALERSLNCACARALDAPHTETVPVILCEDEKTAEAAADLGYEVYVKRGRS